MNLEDQGGYGRSREPVKRRSTIPSPENLNTHSMEVQNDNYRLCSTSYLAIYKAVEGHSSCPDVHSLAFVHLG